SFGLGHLADHSRAAARPEHVQLTFIDPRRPVLAGVIDPQYAGDFLDGLAVAGQPMAEGLTHVVPRWTPVRCSGPRNCRKARRQHPVMTREATRFQPASEIPHSDHATSSQRTGCWPRICAFNASTVSAAVAAPLQALGPANQCRSTPT